MQTWIVRSHTMFSALTVPGTEGSSYGGGSMGGAVGVASPEAPPTCNSGFFSSASMTPLRANKQ